MVPQANKSYHLAQFQGLQYDSTHIQEILEALSETNSVSKDHPPKGKKGTIKS